jgi:hypothetical protein
MSPERIPEIYQPDLGVLADSIEPCDNLLIEEEQCVPDPQGYSEVSTALSSVQANGVASFEPVSKPSILPSPVVSKRSTPTSPWQDPNSIQYKLRDACIHGHMNAVRMLIENAQEPPASLINSPVDQDGVLPLHWASINGHLDLVRYLVQEAGALVDVPAGPQWATAALWAARRGHVSVLHELFQRGANVTDARDSSGQSALHLAALSGSALACLYLVSGVGMLPDTADRDGRPPLLLAILGENESTSGYTSSALSALVCSTLLALGAHANAQVAGFPILHWALHRRNTTIVELLVAYGADPRMCDPSKKDSICTARELGFPASWICEVLETPCRYIDSSDSRTSQGGSPSLFQLLESVWKRGIRRSLRVWIRNGINMSYFVAISQRSSHTPFESQRKKVDLIFTLIPGFQFAIFIVSCSYLPWWGALLAGTVGAAIAQYFAIQLFLKRRNSSILMEDDFAFTDEDELVNGAAFVVSRLRSLRTSVSRTPYLSAIVFWILAYVMMLYLCRLVPVLLSSIKPADRSYWEHVWFIASWLLCTGFFARSVFGDPGYLQKVGERPIWPPPVSQRAIVDSSENEFRVDVDTRCFIDGKAILELADRGNLTKSTFCLSCMVT